MKNIFKRPKYGLTYYASEESKEVVGTVTRTGTGVYARWIAQNKFGETWEFNSRDKASAWLEKLLEHKDYR